jgi:hypothetical protein
VLENLSVLRSDAPGEAAIWLAGEAKNDVMLEGLLLQLGLLIRRNV